MAGSSVTPSEEAKALVAFVLDGGNPAEVLRIEASFGISFA